MSDIVFPGGLFPAAPTTRLRVPETWEPFLAPGTVLAAGAPTAHGEFRPNATVVWTRALPPYSLADVGAEVLARYEAYEKSALIGQGPDPNDPGAWWCEASFAHPDAGTLVQTNAVTVVNGNGVVDVVHACATCTAEQVDQYLLEMRRTVRSIQASRS